MANEKRLIDADALMKSIRLHDYPLATKHNSMGKGMFTIGIQQMVEEQPTVDAVEVVRCKDCWRYESELLCGYMRKDTPGMDFCGCGERKTENDTKCIENEVSEGENA